MFLDCFYLLQCHLAIVICIIIDQIHIHFHWTLFLKIEKSKTCFQRCIKIYKLYWDPPFVNSSKKLWINNNIVYLHVLIVIGFYKYAEYQHMPWLTATFLLMLHTVASGVTDMRLKFVDSFKTQVNDYSRFRTNQQNIFSSVSHDISNSL